MAHGFCVSDYAFAHRGLWDETRPENSLSAFRAARAAGVGAECDVHLSRDGIVVVHHDTSLGRLSGQPLNISDVDAEWLSQTPLLNTQETIPSLAQALAALRDQPMLVELKVSPTTDRDALAAATLRTVATHDGPVALMSFDGAILALLRTSGTDLPLGLLTTPLYLKSEEGRGDVLNLIGALSLDFFAPHVIDAADGRALVDDQNIDLACWTVAMNEHLQLASEAKAAVIFENLPPHLVTPAGAPK